MGIDKELAEACTEVHDLGDILFPKDKSKCSHVALGKLFIKIKDGCIMRCANCGVLVVNKCPCAIGHPVIDTQTDIGFFVLPCDAIEGLAKGLYK